MISTVKLFFFIFPGGVGTGEGWVSKGYYMNSPSKSKCKEVDNPLDSSKKLQHMPYTGDGKTIPNGVIHTIHVSRLDLRLTQVKSKFIN